MLTSPLIFCHEFLSYPDTKDTNVIININQINKPFEIERVVEKSREYIWKGNIGYTVYINIKYVLDTGNCGTEKISRQSLIFKIEKLISSSRLLRRKGRANNVIHHSLPYTQIMLVFQHSIFQKIQCLYFNIYPLKCTMFYTYEDFMLFQDHIKFLPSPYIKYLARWTQKFQQLQPWYFENKRIFTHLTNPQHKLLVLL